MDRTRIETIKALTTYATIALVVVGGMAAIVLLDMQPDKLAIVAGLVGAGLAFLTNGETATRTARQVTAAHTTNGEQRQAFAES